MIKCIDCGRELDPDRDHSWAEVLGFERARVQGGTNHIAFRQQTGRWLCQLCVTNRRYGGGSPRLF